MTCWWPLSTSPRYLLSVSSSNAVPDARRRCRAGGRQAPLLGTCPLWSTQYLMQGADAVLVAVKHLS
eukprot:2322929-Pyramimonas_sp.AAC.1